ncbi:RhoGEF Gef2 [Schizosaccharomyces japonicus yFS275]|uniref:RhoGEF Gef2 n=1 Tax=Schizosaccharomyces japonicus (strain yFS275 / FY16936) TaxID=402676 RepID=B6JWM9_SCHJY|nr:RhoGEF Gef2 [Schizosaccharomyces japonicus yFS275]EEB05780.1 RhoGEF Gef2 [Schizosaccharomyces japonicus yFS275]
MNSSGDVSIPSSCPKIQHGALWLFRHMYESNPTFERHLVYCTFSHNVLGMVLIAFAQVEDQNLLAFVLSQLGPDAFTISPSMHQKYDSFVRALNLNWKFSGSERNAAICLLEYLCADPVTFFLGENWQDAVIDPAYANTLFCTMRIFRSSSLTDEILSVSEPHGSTAFQIDVVFNLPEENSLRTRLASLLSHWGPILGLPCETGTHRKKTSSPNPSVSSSKRYDSPAGIRKKYNLIREMIQTEATFVQRLRHLVNDYAAPLRRLSKSGQLMIGLYEINTLFPQSLNKLIQINSSFLDDIEAITSGLESVELPPEIDEKLALCLGNHFAVFSQHYPRYLEQSSDFGLMLKNACKNTRFMDFVEQVKVSSSMNVSMNQLIMEPVQRIPRYSLFLDQIIALTGPGKTRELYCDALEIIRNIAEMPTIDAEDRSKVFAGLQTLIMDFAPNLISYSRSLISCIDLTRTVVKNSQKIVTFYSIILFNDQVCLVQRLTKAPFASIVMELKSKPAYVTLPKERRAFFLCSAHNTDIELTSGVRDENTLWLVVRNAPEDSYLYANPINTFKVAKHQTLTVRDFIFEFQKTIAYNKSHCANVLHTSHSELDIFSSTFNVEAYKKEPIRSSIIVLISEPGQNVEKTSFLSDGNIIISITDYEEEFSVSFDSWLGISLPVNMVVGREALRERFLSDLVQVKRLLASPFINHSFLKNQVYLLFIKKVLSNHSSPRRSRLSFSGRSISPSRIMNSLKESSKFRSRPKSWSNSLSSKSDQQETPSIRKSQYPITAMDAIDSIKAGLFIFQKAIFNLTEFSNMTDPVSMGEAKHVRKIYDAVTKTPKREYVVMGSRPKLIFAAFKNYLSNYLLKKAGYLLPAILFQRLSVVENLDLSLNSEKAIQLVRDLLHELTETSNALLEIVMSITSELLLRLPRKDQCDHVLEAVAAAISPSMFGYTARQLVQFIAYNSEELFGEPHETEDVTLNLVTKASHSSCATPSASPSAEGSSAGESEVNDAPPGMVRGDAIKDLQREIELVEAQINMLERLREESETSIPAFYEKFNQDLRRLKHSIQASLARHKTEIEIAKWRLVELEENERFQENPDADVGLFI